jgi:PleD family two-component response regulator
MPLELPDGRPSPDPQPLVVLLVDDQPFVAEAVGQLLAGELDLELHFCEQATAAIALANEIAPTIVLQDLVMPDGDGLAMIRAFRLNPATANTPIIVLSANDDAATRALALADGAADFLVKLPSKAHLVECIRRHASTRPGHEMSIDPGVLATVEEVSSPEFMRRLKDQFVQEAELSVSTLKQAVASGDRSAVSDTAHALKGSARIMGARRLAAFCIQVDEQLTDGSEQMVTAALLLEIDQELVRVREAFTAPRAKDGS